MDRLSHSQIEKYSAEYLVDLFKMQHVVICVQIVTNIRGPLAPCVVAVIPKLWTEYATFATLIRYHFRAARLMVSPVANMNSSRLSTARASLRKQKCRQSVVVELEISRLGM